MMAGHQRETEVKIAIADLDAAARLLRRAGFRVSRRKVFEANTVFDTPGRTLRGSGRLLRVRTAGPLCTATYKGPARIGRHKSREELEFGVTDPTMMRALLERLGFEQAFRYEKYRTEFRRPGERSGIAMLDHTPAGDFLELEGSPRWIDRTARELGFSPAEYDTRSYGAVYLEWCAARAVEPADMTFTKPRTPSRSPAPRKGARKSPRGRG
jgi:adenylate cyclase, class 2